METLMHFDAKIGLEVHAQLNTNTKLWCACEVNALAPDNSLVCEICSGQPGALPRLNKSVIEYAAKVALATNCRINVNSRFDRKNYFYPDMPKGYQVTQNDLPIAENGSIDIQGENNLGKKIRIKKIQIEEDSGKLTHKTQSSLVNLNRAGAPLIEIVSEPDLTTGKEAIDYLKNLHSLLCYLEVSDGQLQEGNFRCDINISLSPKDFNTPGVRTEIKNLNSFKNIENAIDLEIQRQARLLESGEKVIQSTLSFDASRSAINFLRPKSNEDNYCFTPEVDLNNLSIPLSDLERWKHELPELPNQKIKRFVENFNIPHYDASVLTSDVKLSHYFENAVKEFSGEPKKISNWIMVELLRLLNEAQIGPEKCPVDPSDLAKLLNFVQEGVISSKQGKEVFSKMFSEKKQASELILELGIVQITDTEEMERIAQGLIANHPEQTKEYHAGKIRLFDFFIGLMMKETKGQANPQIANEVIKKVLERNR